jgi:hypothetical protein
MSRPRLEVNEVWILEEVLPYEGNIMLGAFFDPEVAKGERKGRWRQDSDGDWTTQPDQEGWPKNPFFLLTKHTIRTK